jgi:hypothetical protein
VQQPPQEISCRFPTTFIAVLDPQFHRTAAPGRSMNCGWLAWLAMAATAVAQEATIAAGVPLRVALERRVAIQRVGQPIQGRLVDPIYVYDRVALPAGSVVEGRLAGIGGVPARRRLVAILSGNFMPPREGRAQFDAVVLSDGTRLYLRTALATGTAHTVRIASDGKKRAGAHDARGFAAPGRLSRLRSTLLGMLPYQRRAWPVGTLFNAPLQEPLTVPPGPVARNDEPADREVHARLLAGISSRTAQRGAPVEAVVTRPVFSADGGLLIPEGSRLVGSIVEAQPARRFHRNGKLLFVFRQIRVPAAGTQDIQGYLEGLDADFDAHLALNPEGATRATSPATRFVFPVIAMAVAGLSFHQDYNAEGVPDQDIGGRAEAGGVGLGLIGTLLAQTSRPLASGMAVVGAGFSVYSTFIARGQDVFLPANTAVRVSLAAGSQRGRFPAGEAKSGPPQLRWTAPAR